MYLSVSPVTAVIEAHEQLIAEDRGQELGGVVVQAPVPSPLVQLEEVFEPLVEGFDGSRAAGVQASARRATVEGDAPLRAPPHALQPRTAVPDRSNGAQLTPPVPTARAGRRAAGGR